MLTYGVVANILNGVQMHFFKVQDQIRTLIAIYKTHRENAQTGFSLIFGQESTMAESNEVDIKMPRCVQYKKIEQSSQQAVLKYISAEIFCAVHKLSRSLS